MRWEPLPIPGAHLARPQVHRDERGSFVTTMPGGARPDGRRLRMPIAQASMGRSRAGVVRGIHYTSTPPGCAKIVWCSAGRVLDVVVDTREGSPTYGRSESLELDGEEVVVLYLPVGVGHGYVVLEDDTVVNYLLSVGYVPENEQAVSVADPALGLPLPDRPVLSARDREAPTLARARAAGTLPDFERSVALDDAWWA